MRVLDILLWFPIWAVCSPITVWKDFNPTFFDKGFKDYTLISPRGRAVPTPGPMILDANGDLLNSSYDVAYAITTVGDLQGDLHEFQITENGTALMTAYDPIQADLSSVGGASNGWIFDSVFQEVDIESGELLFQWRASDHYQVNESFASLGEKGGSIETAWDYFHINSIDKDSSGNYYISSRYMHTLDLDRMTASLVQDYVNPHVLSHSQGSVQLLDNGNVFVGWGHTPAWAEFAANGTMLCDAHFGPKITWGLGLVKSYRTSKGRWTGRPRSRPSIELQLGFTYATAYVSWNGATEVQHWRLESTGNPNAANADFVQGPTTHRKGFETAIGIPKDAGRYIRFAALDKNFRLLKYTELLNKNTGHEAGHALSPVLDRDILPLRFLVIASSITTAILLLGRWCIVMARRRAGPTLR
ncbi:hypothetical protein H2203_007540 [Taxawa tesnikishii (nom. ined.)]|nr:hypothetical protein H2203_007540 [Dothideales sp. JES 119]